MTETHPAKRRLGYARVSTYGQTLDAQLEQFRAQGCAKIYREKASGAQADRRELQWMLKAVGSGDVVRVDFGSVVQRASLRNSKIAEAA